MRAFSKLGLAAGLPMLLSGCFAVSDNLISAYPPAFTSEYLSAVVPDTIVPAANSEITLHREGEFYRVTNQIWGTEKNYRLRFVEAAEGIIIAQLTQDADTEAEGYIVLARNTDKAAGERDYFAFECASIKKGDLAAAGIRNCEVTTKEQLQALISYAQTAYSTATVDLKPKS